MKQISLTQGFITLVDDDNFDYLNQFSWQALIGRGKIYARRKQDNNQHILMHREILNSTDSDIVDHIDCNGLNNQKYNLRHVTITQNRTNSRKSYHSNGQAVTSKYKGVYFNKITRKFIAKITKYGRLEYLGTAFLTEIEAAIAYDKAAVYYFGNHAKLNFPKGD